ncbi:MAG: DUF1501 domain-containing protein [Terriglobales bacterium]
MKQRFLFTRRQAVQCLCTSAGYLTMAHALRRFGLMNAYAQDVSDYKALVCVFLFGGNDGNNTIVPMDTNGFSAYDAVRGGSPINLPQSSLLPVETRSGALYGFHSSMPEVQSLFAQEKLAVLANVGPLLRPTNRAQYLNQSVPIPANLFSHSDQQNQWQTSAPNSLSVVGWGGKIADVMQGANGSSQYPLLVSTAGSVVFGSGVTTNPVNLVAQPPWVSQPGVACLPGPSVFRIEDCGLRTNAMQQLLAFDTNARLIQSASDTMRKAFSYSAILNQARAGAPSLDWPLSSGLGDQLRTVAEIIQVRSALGAKRQIFFVSLGGFDTHFTQGATTGVQADLLRELSRALSVFQQAISDLGTTSAVTTFTLSDFGRALQPNTSLGSDHAWGNHQFILGGAVQGREMFGQFPTLALGGPNDASSNGRWIPTTSIDQYGATLARWFGVPDAQLPAIFPHLTNFSVPNLGFLG